jgi:hypothetical protein
MAIDQRDVSSTLRFMDDRALQQYAAMHKSDPYIFPLAFQESQNRQRLRMSQQGAQGMQPQPKVADAALAQMAPQQLPEQMGIGALPAGNMQQMADGGIAGYDDDANFAARSEPVVMMAEGGVARYQTGGVMGDMPGYTPGATPFMPQAGAPEEMPWLQRQIAAAKEQQRVRMLGMARERVATGQGTEADYEALAAEQRKADASAPPTRRSDFAADMSAAPPAPPAAPATPAAPKPDTARRTAPGPGSVVAPTRATPAAGLGDLSKLYQSILDKQDSKDPAAAELSKLEETERAAATGAKEALERDQAKFSEAFKGREKRLTDRELDITKQKDVNTGLALLNAGLSIMSTPGSLATAIGKGAQVGTAQFAAGLDKIRSAQERLDEARDRMEELRLNRDEMSAREIRAAETDIRNVTVNAQKRAIDGIRTAADVNRKTAGEMFKAAVDVGVNRERIASTENIAGMQERGANARATQMPKEMQTAMMLGTGNTDKEKLESGLRRLQEVQAGKFNVSSSYADYLKAFAGKDTMTPPLSFANYAAQFGAVLPR